jgi:hypothetical protein
MKFGLLAATGDKVTLWMSFCSLRKYAGRGNI